MEILGKQFPERDGKKSTVKANQSITKTIINPRGKTQETCITFSTIDPAQLFIMFIQIGAKLKNHSNSNRLFTYTG